MALAHLQVPLVAIPVVLSLQEVEECDGGNSSKQWKQRVFEVSLGWYEVVKVLLAKNSLEHMLENWE